jgi:hypothetical protein
MKMRRGVDAYIRTFLASASVAGERLALRPGRVTPRVSNTHGVMGWEGP